MTKYEDAFSAWEQQLQTWAASLHERVASRSRAGEIRFNLCNRGMASAERLVVELDAGEGIYMLADEKAAKELLGSLKPPKPPKAPERRDQFHDIAALSRPMIPHPIDPAQTDPTLVVWMERPTYDGQAATYGCLDFRPGRDYADILLVAPASNGNDDTHFKVTASANHMTARSETVEIRFEEVEVGWSDPRVLAYLPDDVAHIIGTTS